MLVELDPGSNLFPSVISADANKRGDVVDLIFYARIEGQAAALQITITSGQWENLKFLVDGPKLAES